MKVVPVVAAVALGSAVLTPSHLRLAAAQSTGRPNTSAVASTDRARQILNELPLGFEANAGQADPAVDFLSRGPGYTLFLSPDEALLRLSHGPAPREPQPRSSVVRMKLVNANARAEGAANDRLPGKVNYLIGNDPTRWRTGIPTFAKATYCDVYEGIDIVYYGTQGQLEYDFVVRPGSSPATIDLRFEGADRVELGDHGDLLLHTAGGLVRNGKPFVYQVIDGRRRPVAGAYMLRGASRVGFDVGRYDANVPLVIDPTLVYSTYLGGAQGADIVSGIVVDALGKVYLTGSTSSTDFPATSGAFDTSYNGGPTPQLEGRDVFIAKLNAAGSALEYATYFGGSGLDLGTGIAVDARGRAYVVGYGNSTNVPTTRGAYAEIPFDSWNSFLARLSPDGSALDYATYVGGYTLLGRPNVAVDHTFSAYVAGEISSSRFSATPGAFDATHNGQSDVFVAKLNSSGSGVVYWTYVGGTLIDYPTGVAVDAAGNVYVTGQTQSSNFPTTAGAFDTTLDGGYDGFVLKLNAAGSALEYSTYLGGGEVDVVNGVALDASGHVYVTGQTQSTNFPVSSNAFDPTHNGGPFNGYDAFVAKLNPRGSALDYSTFLGGNGWDYGRAIAVDVLGNAYVTGETSSTDFPTVRAVQSSYGGGISDVFVTKLNGNGSALIYSTYLGGTDNQESAACVAVDHTFNAYVGGHTLALDFPTTPGALAPGKPRTPEGFTAQDGFVAKIADPPGGS